MLKGLGSGTMLPESLKGKAFSIHMPPGVSMAYVQKDGRKGFSLSQFGTPEVNVPAGVDAKALRAALLDLPILPDDLRTQLANIEDWQHTMVVPESQGVEKVNINGTEAVFIQNKHFSNLFWVANGVLYQITGLQDRDTAVQIAASLK